MREILFRGKKVVPDGGWIEGVPVPVRFNNYETTQISMVQYHNYEELENYSLYSEDALVKPETIGQFTGLLDGRGRKIFEGDVLCYTNCFGKKSYGEVKANEWNCSCCGGVYGFTVNGSVDLRDHDSKSMHIVGNVHDNPEWLNDLPQV